MSNGYIETKLTELPDLIEKKEKQVFDLRSTISKDERSKKFIEIQLARDITSEKSNDKQVYSNATMRDDELFKRMGNDVGAVDISNKIDSDKGDLELLNMEHRRLTNDFRAYRSIATLKGGI